MADKLAVLSFFRSHPDTWVSAADIVSAVGDVPGAAKLYVRQIEAGLDGDARAAAKARVILGDMLGPIELTPGERKTRGDLSVEPCCPHATHGGCPFG
jgi:hypothetical protein